jgi:hypothetical protein
MVALFVTAARMVFACVARPSMNLVVSRRGAVTTAASIQGRALASFTPLMNVASLMIQAAVMVAPIPIWAIVPSAVIVNVVAGRVVTRIILVRRIALWVTVHVATRQP